jgi:hypothetical protein
MRNRGAGLILALGAVLAFAPQLPAQSAPRKAAAKAEPDLSGIWYRDAPVLSSGHHDRNFASEENEPPMQPWAEERYRAAHKMRMNLEDPRGPDEANPHLYPYCIPPSMPAVFGTNLFEIVQGPGLVYVLFESSAIQRIYTDGRKHPEGGALTFMGHSIGKWDGDTLLVETVDLNSLNGFNWIDSMGHLYSDALRVEQRIRRVNQNTLQIDFLFDDPKTYTKPWGGPRRFQLKPRSDPRWEAIESHDCENRAEKEFLRMMLGGDRRDNMELYQPK